MKIEELKKRVEVACKNLNLPKPEIIKEGFTFIKMRFKVKEEVRVELYFNEETQTLTTALLVKGERVFGINGYPRSGSWHIHPFGKVEEHREIAPMEIENILQEYANVLRRIEDV